MRPTTLFSHEKWCIASRLVSNWNMTTKNQYASFTVFDADFSLETARFSPFRPY